MVDVNIINSRDVSPFERRIECMKIAQNMFWRGPNRVTNIFKLARAIELWGMEAVGAIELMETLSELDKEDEEERAIRAAKLEADLNEDEISELGSKKGHLDAQN